MPLCGNEQRMAKRFTDTTKYKKSFFRALPGAYKLLWDFLYHDCDHAGIWIVDFETCQLYVGKDMIVSRERALELFNSDEVRIVEIDNGKKWFLPGFIEFQYGKLLSTNRAHNSVIPALQKFGLLESDLSVKRVVAKTNSTPNKPLVSPLEGAKEKEQEKEQELEKEQEGVQGDFDDWNRWADAVVEEVDQVWEAMRGRKVTREEMQEFLSVATRCEWVMKTQQAFRTTLNGFKSNAKSKFNEPTKRTSANAITEPAPGGFGKL